LITHLTNQNFTCWDGTIRQYDVSYNDACTGPLIVFGHGFTGSKANITEEIKTRFCGYGFVCAVITVRKDAGGMEILDYYDLVQEIENEYSDRLNGKRIFCGYSGGGGNGYSALVKLPDLFHAVVVHFGMNDYGAWYDYTPTYKATLESYIGGSPIEVPDNYAARNSLFAIGNNTKTIQYIFHDEDDAAVPVVNADNWATAATAAGIAYTLTRTDSEDMVRALHGYPIVGNSGEPNISFEVSTEPAWVTDILAVETPNISIPSSGTLICGAFIKTDLFRLITGNTNRCSVTYNMATKSFIIDNTDTGNTVTAEFILYNLNPNSRYTYKIDSVNYYGYTDIDGILIIDLILPENNSIILNNFVKVELMNFQYPYAIATINNPSNSLTDFVLEIDLSRMPTDFKNEWNTNDNGRGRAYTPEGTELPSDWYSLDYENGTGNVKVKWSGTLYSTGTQRLILCPPRSTNTQYAVTDTYGKNNVYTDAVAIWPMNGDLTERSGKAYTLSANNGAVAQAGGGYQYDGANDYTAESVGSRIAAATFQSPFTVAMKINPYGYGEGGYGMIIQKSVANNSDDGFVIAMNGTNAKIYARVNAGSLISSNSNTAIIGQLSTIVVTFAIDGTINFYSNGTTKGSGQTGALSGIVATTAIFVGSYTNTTFAYDGFVRYMEIWSGEKSGAWASQKYLQESDQETFWGDWNIQYPLTSMNKTKITYYPKVKI
jgi:pimeloyl-ACP methyl ester carboxylesterase